LVAPFCVFILIPKVVIPGKFGTAMPGIFATWSKSSGESPSAMSASPRISAARWAADSRTIL